MQLCSSQNTRSIASSKKKILLLAAVFKLNVQKKVEQKNSALLFANHLLLQNGTNQSTVLYSAYFPPLLRDVWQGAAV